jgi:cytidine deaminase
MSLNPFSADRTIRDRIASLEGTIGEAVTRDIAAAARDAVLSRDHAETLVVRHGLTGIDDLMLLALPVARKLATPPISSFFVGAVGLERESGNLLFGGNLEFPKSHLGYTIHGEGFLFTRAFHRGTSIALMATGEAHPCAHCRQFLSEFAATRDMVLIDRLGHRLTMAELYPWPFDPAYLGETGSISGTVNWPHLELEPNHLPASVAAALVDRGRHAWAPYSKCPGAVVLSLKDGSTVAGSSIESVAFNPTMTPLQAALIELFAHGHAYGDIAAAALGTVVEGNVDYSAATAELLATVAPAAPLTVVAWRGR